MKMNFKLTILQSLIKCVWDSIGICHIFFLVVVKYQRKLLKRLEFVCITRKKILFIISHELVRSRYVLLGLMRLCVSGRNRNSILLKRAKATWLTSLRFRLKFGWFPRNNKCDKLLLLNTPTKSRDNLYSVSQNVKDVAVPIFLCGLSVI